MEGGSSASFPIRMAPTKAEDNVPRTEHDSATPPGGIKMNFVSDDKRKKALVPPIALLKGGQEERATASSQGPTSPVQNCLQAGVNLSVPNVPKQVLTLEKDLQGIARKYVPSLRIIEGLCNGLKCDADNLAATLSVRLARLGKADQELVKMKEKLTEAQSVNEELTKAANEMNLSFAWERNKIQDIIAHLRRQIFEAKSSRTLTMEQQQAFCTFHFQLREKLKELMQWGEQVLQHDAIGQEELYEAISPVSGYHTIVQLDSNIVETWSIAQVENELNNVRKWTRFQKYLTTCMQNLQDAASLVTSSRAEMSLTSKRAREASKRAEEVEQVQVQRDGASIRYVGRKRTRTSRVPSA